MEITSSNNPAIIQLAAFARNMSYHGLKQYEQRENEFMKRKEVCRVKEKPVSISSLYYSKPAIKSTCDKCHPNTTSIFQRSHTIITLKDLLHKKCVKNMPEVVPCKETIQSFHQSFVTKYFMKAASWFMYHLFRFIYKGVLIHPQQIQCLRQAQDTDSPILYFISTPSPDVKTLCAVYFALYYTGLRPPLIGFERLPWYARFLFSRMGLLKSPGLTTHSMISCTVAPYYADYVNYTIDDIYVVPVAISVDRFIHINFSTPYTLSELEMKLSAAELPSDPDIDDVRDIDCHIRTDIAAHAPVSALCFVAYAVIVCREGSVIGEQALSEGVERMRAEFIREKVGLNFCGKNEHIIKYALDLLKPCLTRRSSGQVELVITNMNQLASHAMPLVMRRITVCVVARAVYSLVNGVKGKADLSLVNGGDEISQEASEGASMRKETTESGNGAAGTTNNSQAHNTVPLPKNPHVGVKHKDIVEASMKLVAIVEAKLGVKVFKFCQIPEEEINKAMGDLSDYQILSSSDKDLLQEEKWSAHIARELQLDSEATNTDMLDSRTYRVDPSEKNPFAKMCLNVMGSLNGLSVDATENRVV